MTGYDLRLLDTPAWQGRAVPGERPQALLAALAAHRGAVSSARLIEAVWGDAPPANPAKALQVLVSRLRAIDRSLVESVDGGYRLGVEPGRVDALAALQAADRAAAALAAGLVAEALDAATTAGSFAVQETAAPGPVADLRADVEAALRRNERVQGLALARSGQWQQATGLLRPVLERAPDDTEVRVALLRAEGATGRVAEALAEYADYRADLAERLGIDPDPELQRVHAELLAADSPVRTGLRYDSDPLVGREEDLVRLRGLLEAGRLVTILGPGGIGKTRIAQVLARESAKPHVHVVELVGVGSGDDVTAEVGTALGIRGSVSSRALTPAQVADVRGRIAQQLDAGPTLLVLDNCEHVLEQVAGLVAFLLVTARDLTVLTTSRAPLRLASEQVVPLTQLPDTEAVALFRRRAAAVRPQARLVDDEIAAVVARLDGLPLAIELAAARVRTLTVTEVAEALATRFDALRSRDRSTPERHRTLAAVIGWSWDLLSEDERRAMARMSVFHDGFDLPAVRVMLGADGQELVEALVEQSMLVHTEADGRSRFRALETIREYAAQRLQESGGTDAAHAAQDAWASGLTGSGADLFVDWDQISVVDRLVREQSNLTDVLRRAIASGDAGLVARLIATLASLWTITGDHPRVFAVADAAARAMIGYRPLPGEEAVLQDAVAALVLHLSWIAGDAEPALVAILSGEVEVSPWTRAAQVMIRAADDDGGPVRALVAEADGAEPRAAAIYLVWAAILSENDGKTSDAAMFVRRAIDCGPLPPYLSATAHSSLAQMMVTADDYEQAARLAVAAAPTLERLHATDDAWAMWVTVALAELLAGDPDACRARLEWLEAKPEPGQQGSRMMVQAARAELALAQGRVEEGLRGYERTVDLVTGTELPVVAISPWLAMAGSACLAAHARYGAAELSEDVRRLREQLRDVTGRVLDDSQRAGGYADLPFTGSLLVGLASASLRWGSGPEVDDAVAMLAAAHCWSYNRNLPVLSWSHWRDLAERRRPGRLDVLLSESIDRPASELRADLRRRIAGAVTSSG